MISFEDPSLELGGATGGGGTEDGPGRGGAAERWAVRGGVGETAATRGSSAFKAIALKRGYVREI